MVGFEFETRQPKVSSCREVMLIVLLFISDWSCARYVLVGTVLVGVMYVIGNVAAMVAADRLYVIVK